MIDEEGTQRAKRTLELATIGLFGVALVVVAIIAFPQVIGASHSYTVVSDSMNPDIQAGDVVIVRDTPTNAIETRDVITFRRADSSGQRITHRVVDVVNREDRTYFRTKGDANEEADPTLVSSEQVIGVVWFHIPYVGYGTTFASSKHGILMFVIVPAVLLVVSESYVLVRAALAESSDGDDSTNSDDGSADSETAAAETEVSD